MFYKNHDSKQVIFATAAAIALVLLWSFKPKALRVSLLKCSFSWACFLPLFFLSVGLPSSGRAYQKHLMKTHCSVHQVEKGQVDKSRNEIMKKE